MTAMPPSALRPLIIGSRGQLGQALMRARPNAVGVWREQLDLASDALEMQLAGILNEDGGVDGVINAAAYTAVDAAEDDLETAMRVNAHAPGVIARACAARGLPLVHISTDYVFKGDATAPYTPDQATDPLNAYGVSKRDGETAILAAGAVAAILRTSWVYDTSNKNFVTTMLRLAETRDALSVVGDQIGRPTHTDDLAAAALAALDRLAQDPSLAGIYHVSNSGDPISWAQFATAIFDAAGKAVAVTAIPSSEYPTPAKRPAYSVMDISRFEAVMDHPLRDWRIALNKALRAD